jgi:hypothetical protein
MTDVTHEHVMHGCAYMTFLTSHVMGRTDVTGD